MSDINLKVLCEASHNIEQIDNLPEYLIVELNQAQLEQLQQVRQMLQQTDMHSAERLWGISSMMYQVAEDEDIPDVELDGKRLIEFETDYRLEGEHLRVHNDGRLVVFCPLKHSQYEEVWATIGTIDELLLKLNNAYGDKMAPVGVE